MTENHAVDEHHGPNMAVYLGIFAALSVCTVMSFVFYMAFGAGSMKGATLIMLVAVLKALLVGAIFMHLKYDWPKLYFLIGPVFIMAAMMMVVLLPDMVIAWHTEASLDGPTVKVERPH